MPTGAAKQYLAKALDSVKEKVHAEGNLSGDEDICLVAQIDLKEYLEIKYNRPPGVTTLEAWERQP